MKNHNYDMSHSALCVAPLEGHEFVGKEYECEYCHRPMALHRQEFEPTYKDSDLTKWKPLGRIKPRNEACGFPPKPKSKKWPHKQRD